MLECLTKLLKLYGFGILKCLLLFVVMHLNNSLSRIFAVENGVRYGSVLSPSIFSVFMNAIILNLRLLDVGCHVNRQFVGLLLYADDIILILPSVIRPQQMLDIRLPTAKSFELKFNGKKSHCFNLGKLANICHVTRQ